MTGKNSPQEQGVNSIALVARRSWRVVHVDGKLTGRWQKCLERTEERGSGSTGHRKRVDEDGPKRGKEGEGEDEK